MHARAILTLAGVAALAGLLVSACSRVSSARADESRPRSPVLVELFTSEGCSSCPPAEDELRRLEREQSIASVELVPIAFHVDYWDDLGWADPFSSSAWSDRQRDYDRSSGRVYTPQAVVQGQSECVGSDDAALRTLAQRAAESPAARLMVTSTPAAPGRVHVTVAVPPGAREQADVRVVLVERGVVVEVPRGENRGRRLEHAPLARDMVSAGVVTAAGGAFEATLRAPVGSRPENLGVVALAQEHASRRVVGVGTLVTP